MFSFDNTIEFTGQFVTTPVQTETNPSYTDIVLKSPLPLAPYLVENSRLSLRLIVNGVPCSETPVANGDHETGRWVMNARLHV